MKKLRLDLSGALGASGALNRSGDNEAKVKVCMNDCVNDCVNVCIEKVDN